MISFPNNMVLEDGRVLMRPLELTDIGALLPYAINEPETWDYSIISPAGEAGMNTYIATAIEQRNKKIEYPFIVFDKAANVYAGSTRFYDIQLHNQSTQLGYTWYGKDFRRTGLNRHCKLLMLTYAFEAWGMERVEFRADARNEQSVNAMKDIGCTVEGILRSNAAIDSGGRRDSIVLSILKSEWFGGAKENLTKKIYP
ncbi:MAG: GNAT family N-acetyltransferase [Bacteroidetes bacterium]|nr:GNAT family N-acetyltransferase [Bacteroidota bacterium]MBS1973052.1 GNAT family N-acetyltransferase [Bacteroidota bacterium]